MRHGHLSGRHRLRSTVRVVRADLQAEHGRSLALENDVADVRRDLAAERQKIGQARAALARAAVQQRGSDEELAEIEAARDALGGAARGPA